MADACPNGARTGASAHVTPSTAAVSARRAGSFGGLGATGCRGPRGRIQSHGGGGGWRRAESDVAFDGAAKFDETNISRGRREYQHGCRRAVYRHATGNEVSEYRESDSERLAAAFA